MTSKNSPTKSDRMWCVTGEGLVFEYQRGQPLTESQVKSQIESQIAQAISEWEGDPLESLSQVLSFEEIDQIDNLQPGPLANDLLNLNELCYGLSEILARVPAQPKKEAFERLSLEPIEPLPLLDLIQAIKSAG